MQINEILESIHQFLAFFAPYPWLRAFIIIVIFLMLGKIADFIVSKVLSKLVAKTETDFDDRVLGALHRPIFLSVFLIGLSVATYEYELKENVTIVTIRVLKTIAIFVWFRFFLILIKLVLDELEQNENRFKFISPTTKPLLLNTASILVVAFAVYGIFLIWSIDITAWIASAGIIGLAISFAAKDTLANVFGGVAIFADKPFKVGDYINLESGERGVITEIGVRSTRILTRDDVEITVPNGILATTKIINESGGPSEKFRVRVKVGVSYGSDIDKVENILIEVAKTHEEICEYPEPRVRFRNFGDSSLDYELLCWVERPVLRGRILHELHRQVYKTFIKENIEIPFPQRDIHVKQIPKMN